MGTNFAPTASLVVPTRNALPLLRFTLESLRHQDAPAAAYEVVVVDDASTDGTSDWLAAYRPSYRLTALPNPIQLGRGVTRNRGLEAASGEIVVFLDGDMICPPSFVSAHLRLHAEGEARGLETCVTGYPWFWRSVATWSFQPPERPLLDPALLARWRDFEVWAGGPLGEPGSPVAVARPDAAPFLWCITRVVSLRRSFALEVGGFDRRFRGYGLEDTEFGYRLSARGVRIVSHPAAAAFHQVHPAGDYTAEYERNYYVFLALHPDFEVALLSWCPPLPDGRYLRLCAAHHRLRRAAPALAEALREVAVDHAWARQQRQPVAVRGWAFWAGRWGAGRVACILSEQPAAMADPQTGELLLLFQQLTGLAPS